MGIFCFSLTLTGASGCLMSTAPTGPARVGLATVAPQTEVLLFGRLTPRRTTGISGATVAVYEILPDNRLLPVADHVVQTEEDGTYRVRVRLSDAYQGPLLVRADCEFGYGMVLVSDTQVVNGGLAALPITDATTVQAQVYLTAKQQHLWPATLDAVLLHRFMGESLARAALLEGDHTQVTETLARAVTAAAISFDKTLHGTQGGLSKQDWQQARKVLHSAYFSLADALYYANDPAAVGAAQRAFDRRLAAAQAREGGAPEPAWTVASQAAMEAFLPYVGALPPGVQAEAMLQMEQWRARDVVALVARTFGGPHQDAAASHQLEQSSDLLLATLMALHGDRDTIAHAAREAWGVYQSAIGPVLVQLLEPSEQATLTRALAELDRQAATATEQLARLDASVDPSKAAAEAHRLVASVFATVGAPDHDTQAKALAALGNVCLARLR